MDQWIRSHLSWQVGILIAIEGVLWVVLVALANPLGLGTDGIGTNKAVVFGIGFLLIVIGLAIVEARVGTPGRRE
jgi:hypothetical protein